MLNPPVSGSEDRRDGKTDEADQHAGDGGLHHPAARGSHRQMSDAVEALRVEEADQAGEEADKREVAELDRMIEVVATEESEDGRESFDRAEDGEPDDRCDDRWDQGIHLEVAPIQDLRSEDRAPQRRAEDRADTGPDADGNRDPRVRGREVELTSEHRPEARADLGGRTLPPR